MVVAAVSQVEHGIMHLVSPENPEVTVLVDCEGLSPFKIPMQVMRSCSSLLQDHYPNRLGCLFVIRLPPVVRVIAQTFIQVNFLLLLKHECVYLIALHCISLFFLASNTTGSSSLLFLFCTNLCLFSGFETNYKEKVKN